MAAVQLGSAAEALAVLQGQTTAHAGTPNSATMTRALKLIRQHAPDLYALCMALAGTDSPTAQELAAALLAGLYPSHPAEAEATLVRLADSPSWEVREWVASACGAILGAHFGAFYPAMLAWTQHPSGNIRRAAALAAMYAGKARVAERAAPLLDLAERLLPDRDPYVRKNLGAFVIGDGLLRCYPEQVLERLPRWAAAEDEQVRWNVAMVFASAQGAAHPQAASAILAELARDPRPTVQRACATALRNLAKRSSNE